MLRSAVPVLLVFSALAEQKVASVRDIYNGTLSTTVEVQTFSHIDQVFPSALVKASHLVSALPAAAYTLRDFTFPTSSGSLTLSQYIQLNSVTGLLVLHDGKIALER